MDEATASVLASLDFPNVNVVAAAALERHDPDLLAVKPTRSTTEYYWTATPAICLFTLDHFPEVDHVVHLDADLEFYADPGVLFDELGADSVLLVPHRPAPEFAPSDDGDDAASGGRFNVQFEIFRHDDRGLAALRWWRERCLEWCYDRIEPTRYGDQKYLDEMFERFAGIKECEHPGAGLAPWNVGGQDVERRGTGFNVDGRPLVFHHFQSLELHRAGPVARRLATKTAAYRLTPRPVELVWTTGWRLTQDQLTMLWQPYVGRLSEATALLETTGVVGSQEIPRLRPLRALFHVIRRRVPGPALKVYWNVREWTSAALWRLRGSPR